VAFAVIDDGRGKLIESGKKSVDAFKLGIFCGLPNYLAGNLKRKIYINVRRRWCLNERP
jgi:hypothetical protein